MSEPRVVAEGLSAGYGGPPALRDVSFAAEPGQSVCVLGPNGGGKTTLFRALLGELRPAAGSLRLTDRPAYLAQTDRTRLDFPVNALDVALMGTLSAGRWWRPPAREDRARAHAALGRVGLADSARVPFGELSGGQRRRALLARSLVQGAEVMLLDEPLSGVDPASAELIAGVFDALRAEGRTLLVSTHDVASARAFDLVLCLNGRQVAFGPPAAVLDAGDAGGHLRTRADRPQPRRRGAARDGAAPPHRALTVEILDPILDPLRSGIDRRALLEIALLGAVCGALGFWVVVERLSYAAESLSHGLLPGLVLAALAGAPLLLGAAGGVAVAAALIAVAARDPRIGPEAGTGVVVTGLVGLGALLALSPDSPQRLEELLFGDPLGVSDSDLIAAAALAGLGGLALFALHRPLAATAFDGATAAALGVRPQLIRLALVALVAAAVAVAVQGLGALLSLALIVGPAIAVRRRAHSTGRAVMAGAATGVAGGIVGIYASYHVGTAAGASVALALCLAAAAGSLPLGSRATRARAAAARPGA